MGKHTVRFKCHHCLHCCTELAALPTPNDVIRIAETHAANPYDFLEFLDADEITGVAKNDPTWLESSAGRHIMALRRDAKGCHFLDPKSRHCTIYLDRPLLCRLYPFKLQETRDGAFKGFTLHADVECPKNRDGEMPVQPLYELYLRDQAHQERYHALVQEFNAKPWKRKRPEEFIGHFLPAALRRKFAPPQALPRAE